MATRPNHARRTLFVAGIAALIFFFQLGTPPLWDRDEPRNAGCAAEMLEANDWVVPIFNAELRTHKPVLLYWMMMASYAVFGVNEFAARLPSALLGMGNVLLTMHIGRRLFGSAVAQWAGVILCSTIMFGVASRAATPDALLIFCSTLAMALFVEFAFPKLAESGATPRQASRGASSFLFPESLWQAIAIYAAMGFAVLAKGPVGLVLPTAVIGMYLLIKRLPPTDAPKTWLERCVWFVRPFAPLHFLRTCWSMRPVTAMLTAAIIAVPWYVWVAMRTNGEWTREFFWTHNVGRTTGVMEGHSGPPILFYLVAIMVGFFPWSILTVPAGMHLRTLVGRAFSNAGSDQESTTQRDGLILSLCWVGVWVGLFSLARTKLPSYITPCYPALALLAGLFVHDWFSNRVPKPVWLKVGLGNLMVVGGLLLVGLPIAAARFLPGVEWLGIVGLIPLVGGGLAWWYYKRQNNPAASGTLAVTAILFSLLVMSVVPVAIGKQQPYADFLATAARHEGPIASWGHLEPTWVFYGRRAVTEFRPSEREQFIEFLEENPDTLVITTERELQPAETSDGLFAQHRVVEETGYFLRDRKLLLVEPGPLPVTRVARGSRASGE